MSRARTASAAGIRMKIRGGRPSAAGGDRWNRRSDVLASLLLEMWSSEHSAATAPSPTTDFSTTHPLTPPSIEPLLLTTSPNPSVDRTDANP